MPIDETTGPLITRSDTLLGICQGVGEDTGLPPIVLRIALAALVLVSPLAAIGLYALLGVVLMASRWLIPAAPAVIPNS